MKLLEIVGTVITLLLVFLFVHNYFWITHTQPSNTAVQPLSEDSSTYANSIFGYALTYHTPWQITNDYSKYLFLYKQILYAKNKAGCLFDLNGDSLPQDKMGTCLAANAEYQQFLHNQLPEIQTNWDIASSDIVVLTDLSPGDITSFVAALNSGTKSVNDFPLGHSIQISPTEFPPIPKEGHNTSTVIKIIALPTGGKVSWDDSDLTYFGGDRMLINIDVGHSFAQQIISVDGTRLVVPQGLVLHAEVIPANKADLEKVLTGLVDSLAFKP